MNQPDAEPGDTRSQKRPLLRWPLILLALLALLYHAETTSSLALGPRFSQEFHLTNVQVALATNAAILFSSLLAIPLALAVDAYQRVRIPLLAVGALVWGGLTGLRGLANGFLGLLSLSALSGVGLASSTAPSSDLLCDLIPPKRRSQALGILGAGQALGVLLGFLVPGILTRFLNWRYLYVGFAACGLILMLPLLRLREPPPGPIDEALLRRPARSWWRNVRAGTFHILHNRGALVGIAGFAAQSFGIGGIATFLPIFLVRSYASSDANADSLVSGVVVALLFGTTLGGFVDARLARRYGVGSHTLVAGGATVVLGFLFGLAVVLPTLLLFLVLSVASGLLLGITTAPLLALIGDLVVGGHRSYAYALQVAIGALCQALGGVVVGELADQFHSLRLALLLFSVVVIAVGGWLAAQTQRIVRNQEATPPVVPIKAFPHPLPLPQPLPAVSQEPPVGAPGPFAVPPPLLPPEQFSPTTLSQRSWTLDGWGGEDAEALETAAQALGSDVSVWFFSPGGFRILVHPKRSSPGWLYSHLLPGFGVSSIQVPSRITGILLALRECYGPPQSP